MTTATRLENIEASIKQLKKQWNEMDVSIQNYDQRCSNFEIRYYNTVFALEDRIKDLEMEISNLKKKMGVVDNHV